MSDPYTQRDLARRLEQTQVIERPGGVTGFTTFYATGSFTPVWVGSGTAGTFTYNASVCLVEWTRIGNRVLFNGRIEISAITVAPTGNLTITGWPFPGVADTNMAIAGGGSFGVWTINVAAGYTDVAMYIVNGGSAMFMARSGDNVAPAVIQGGELIVGACWFEGSYRVA